MSSANPSLDLHVSHAFAVSLLVCHLLTGAVRMSKNDLMERARA